MSSGNHANYASVGLAVVLGVAGIVGTLFWIGGGSSDDDLVYAETYFENSVSGLSVGSAVNFRGVKIGEVKEISFVGNKYLVDGLDNQRIYVLLALNRKYIGFRKSEVEARQFLHGAVKRGLRATVTASGITGLSRIECDMKEHPTPAEPISWQPETVYIPPSPSLLESFSDAAVKVMNQINRMDMTSVWSNLNSTVRSLAQASEATERMVESRQADIERILENISSAAADMKELAAELKENPSLLLRDRTLSPLPETSERH